MTPERFPPPRLAASVASGPALRWPSVLLPCRTATPPSGTAFPIPRLATPAELQYEENTDITLRRRVTRGGYPMKIYLIAPKNPESFWTLDRILRSLNKKCVFPNLSLPTVAGITPREHEVVLCDENVERIDFDTDADIIGLTGYVIHKQRLFAIAGGGGAGGRTGGGRRRPRETGPGDARGAAGLRPAGDAAGARRALTRVAQSLG